MAKKKAVTYYVDSLHRDVRDVEIHESGREALDYFYETYKRYFSFPAIWKNKKKPTKLPVSVGYPQRKYYCRFLTEVEIGLLENNDLDDLYWNFNTNELIAEPEEVPVNK